MRVASPLLSFLLFVLTTFACALGYEKKSDFSEFASAINSAGRLRYGKRAVGDTGYPLFFNSLYDIDSDTLTYNKRAPMASKLIQSLNGAERLRFGRK